MGMMRRTKRGGNILLCLLINIVLNLEGSIPALILLGLHFWLGISLWWCIGALVLWVLGLWIGMWLMGWAADCGSIKDPPKENKNPYSVRKGKENLK